MSEKVGQGSEAFAVHTKGQEVPMHDPRARSTELSMSYAMSPTGADHVHTSLWSIFKNCATMCVMPWYEDEKMLAIVNGVTGWALGLCAPLRRKEPPVYGLDFWEVPYIYLPEFWLDVSSHHTSEGPLLRSEAAPAPIRALGRSAECEMEAPQSCTQIDKPKLFSGLL
jgi:hypothetical protein